jgi:hypothetical protein
LAFKRPAVEYGSIRLGKMIAGQIRSVAKLVEKSDQDCLHQQRVLPGISRVVDLEVLL